jgi:pimeloyl-ACP methyl ester carboxylesterase
VAASSQFQEDNMPVGTQLRTGTAEVNGASLYYEVRGVGPAVVFVSGTTGDAGHFERVAELLADEFTCVSYDRRGNSRSPRPPAWSQTSTDEQADDLAGLIRALGVEPATVYGTSVGAIITLATVLRHEHQLRAAILHEPPLMSVLAHPEDAMAIVQPIIESGMARGGTTGALEAFLGFAAGDALDSLPPATVERMMGNAETVFGIEFGNFESWRPDEQALDGVTLPMHVMSGNQSAPFFAEASGWLAEQLGTACLPAPGTHVPNFNRPEELVNAIRPFLQPK